MLNGATDHSGEQLNLQAFPFVFNIGLNRAGTTSLTKALNSLGLPTLHFKFRDHRLYDLARHNMKLGRRLFTGLDDQYKGFSDFAGQAFFRLLDQQYPGSKFILTTRDLEAWLLSREKKVRQNLERPDYQYHFRKINRDEWIQQYRLVHRHTRAYFADRPQDFLVIDIAAGEGWSQLCPFLGLPIPSLPFPNLNALPG